MARPLSGDIWHLSIDDLLAPLPEAPRLGGPGPFVINLSASTAPISQPIKGVVGCPDSHVYQIQRAEDRRLRYRLRLGPFMTEDEADAVLVKVRDIYPGALTATADAEDLRALEAIQTKINAQTKATLQPKVDARPKADAQPKVDAPAAVDITRRPPDSIPVLSEAVSVGRPASARAPVLRQLAPQVPPAAIDPAPVAASEAKPWAQSPAAAASEDIPWASEAIPWVVEPPKVQPPAVKPSVDKPSAVQPSVVRPLAIKPSTATAAAAKPVEPFETSLPSFESTQTIRPLTRLELEDVETSRWFVIQLSTADQAFDPDSLPNLDIFTVYRLYSVAGLDQGRIMHALRLGFFKDEIAAGTVASYLTAFYQGSTVKRVSAAERERFANQSFEARKDVGATGRHSAIEITGDRVVRESRIAGTAPTPQKSVDPTSAPGRVAQKSRWF